MSERGEKGEKGEDAKAIKVTDHRLLLLWVVTLCVGGYAVYHVDQNAESIRRGQVRDHDSQVVLCEVQNRNVVSHNRLIDSLVEAVANTPYLSAAEQARRSKEYIADKSQLLDCTKGG